MQAYSQHFAHLYDLKWGGFAIQIAPQMLKFYANTPLSQTNTSILDVGCGTGQLACYFLEHGYRVTGIDLSAPMLDYARSRAASYLETGQARFLHADATTFTLPERFGLVMATYDTLNHLANETALTACFQRVYAVAEGYFVCDLNTKAGLHRWNGLHVEENVETVIITRGIFSDDMDKAWTKISGFLRTAEGGYERVEETIFNTPFVMETVKEILLQVGWREVYFARITDLSHSISEPEQERRVFIVAQK